MKYKFWNRINKGSRGIFFIAAVFMLAMVVLTRLTDYTRQVKILGYSKFIKAVEQDQVKSVHVIGQDVYGALKDNSHFETVIPENAAIYDQLKAHCVEYSVGVANASISPWYFLMLALFLGIPLAAWYFIRQNKGNNNSGGGIFSMGKSRARMFTPSAIKVTFNDVAGAEQAKEALLDIVDFLKNPEKYAQIGAKIPRGVLLVGEPGNGKTLLAKAIAGEAQCPFFSITGSDFIEVFVGVGAARVRDLFAQARKHAPSIIFIDEIDAIGRARGSGFGGGHDEREQTLNQLLTEMDGFDSAGSPVIVIAATNMPDVLDKALLRAGRFDRTVTVPYPDTVAREQILRVQAKTVALSDDVDLAIIAAETAGFSGADLANLFNEAAILASKKNQSAVTMADMMQAHKHILSTREQSHINPSAGGQVARSGGKFKMIMPSQIKVKFADVAGIPEAKEELMEVVDFLKNPEKYKRLGAKLPKGILLVGDPGNGKTLLAKAVAGEANCPFFSVSGSDFVEMYVGVGASRIRELFAQARRHMPSIIFIDEIDAVGSKRATSGEGGSEYAQTLNQLLTEMDGFGSDSFPVIVIAATNRPDMLDSALTRPGRFDKRVDIPYPDLLSRRKILAVHVAKIKVDESIDLDRIARGTPGFSGADLAQLVNEAALSGIKHEHALVTMHDFEEARDKIMLGKALKSVILSEKEREMVAYHEAGHAIVGLMLPDTADPLHKVTIIPRGFALGVTHSLPERDQYLSTEPELRTELMVCLGGRIAEEIKFGVLSSGASNDFEKSSAIARRMVCRYGMSSEVGTIVYTGNESVLSEKTAQKIDEAVEKLVTQMYQKTYTILSENRDKLEILAKALLEKETLYADEIYPLLGIKPRESFKLVD